MMMRKAASMGLRDLVYRLYERRLAAALSPDAIPRHVGVMCDGNRRWARSAGFRDVSSGHRKGADKIFELLEWCRESGVEVVTLWLLSTDNLTRSSAELVAAAEDHRGHRAGPGGGAVAREPGRRAGPAARRHGPGAEGRGRRHRAPSRAARQRGGGVRRPAGDRRRGALPAAGAGHEGHHDRGTGRGARRRAHRRAPLHGRASPTPTWSSAPRASSAWAASCSGRAPTPSSTSATPTGPPSARSTSSARCAPTRRGTGVSARKGRFARIGGFAGGCPARVAVLLLARDRGYLR